MAVNTVLLDFTIGLKEMGKDKIESAIFSVLSSYLQNLKKVYEMQMDGGGFFQLLTAADGTFITVRMFPTGLITLNVEYFKEESKPPLLNFQKLEENLSKILSVHKWSMIPPVKRDAMVRFFPTSDERILEYDIDELIFEEKSPYQKVQIVHSKTFGNMLILDGLQNLSEMDLIYTETLMQRGIENYKDKEIVILGGGDGALLCELLKEQPKNVIMLEIDPVVIEACKKYLRSCCGDTLDNMKGTNYEIIIGDCFDTLKTMVSNGQQFDYVFGDLTDAPLSTHACENWDFVKLIINFSLKILRPNGKYMTHCCGTSSDHLITEYEKMLSGLEVPVEFSKTNAFVPSFLESWLFYQLWQKQTS